MSSFPPWPVNRCAPDRLHHVQDRWSRRPGDLLFEFRRPDPDRLFRVYLLFADSSSFALEVDVDLPGDPPLFLFRHQAVLPGHPDCKPRCVRKSAMLSISSFSGEGLALLGALGGFVVLWYGGGEMIRDNFTIGGYVALDNSPQYRCHWKEP